jgi:serine phosphatase RsbU (regulator of sigma subunit)
VLKDPEISVLARYRPGRRRALLGGDFYDIVEDSDGTLNLLIGDVCGHGPDQAAVGVSLRLSTYTSLLPLYGKVSHASRSTYWEKAVDPPASSA